MAAREKILDKVAKLLAKADNTQNIHESETFAAKANELMLRHEISMGEVEAKQREEDDPLGKLMWDPTEHGVKFRRQRVHWMEYLAKTVAEANFCKILVYPGTNYVFFLGRESHREVVEYLYSFLVREIEEHAQKAYNRAYYQAEKDGDTERVKGFLPSFRRAAIIEIHRRFEERRESIREEVTETEFALIKVADTAVIEYTEQETGGKAGAINGQSGFSHEGYRQGQKFGREVTLDARGVEGSPRGEITD